MYQIRTNIYSNSGQNTVQTHYKYIETMFKIKLKNTVHIYRNISQ